MMDLDEHKDTELNNSRFHKIKDDVIITKDDVIIFIMIIVALAALTVAIINY